jgi:hypothetical protein
MDTTMLSFYFIFYFYSLHISLLDIMQEEERRRVIDEDGDYHQNPESRPQPP